jgi:hypothetical protein
MQMNVLDFLGIQEKTLLVQVRETVHGINLAVPQQVKENGRAGLVQELFLLDSEGLHGHLNFHEANIEHVFGKAKTFTSTGLIHSCAVF